MTATIKQDGRQLSLTLSYIAHDTNIQATLTNVAKYAFENFGMGDHGTDEAPRVFADLDNSERLTLIDSYVRYVLLDTAQRKYIIDDEERQRQAAFNEHEL